MPMAVCPTDGSAEHVCSSSEAIIVKLLTRGTEDGLASMRIELSSETDLFFYYSHALTAETFGALREEQRLKIDFMEFPDSLIKMFNSCIRDAKVYVAILKLFVDGTAQLEFVQNTDYKTVELLSLRFRQSEDELVQRHVTFRYNSVKRSLAVAKSRLHEMTSMVKARNPSLLAARGPPQTSKHSEEASAKRPFYT